MPTKACLFDMGNVLVHFSHEKMCQNIADVCQQPIERCRELLFENDLQQRIETGLISEEDFHREFEKHLECEVPFQDLKRAAADIFTLNEDIVPLLHQLKQAGIRLVLLSNTSVTHVDFIRQKFDVLDLFDDLTVSYEVKAMKPAAAIYHDAVGKAGCEPSECFYTDDIEDYILAARKLNIAAAVFTNVEQLRDDMQQHGII